MSFLGDIAKGVGIIGGIIAAPATGGASLALTGGLLGEMGAEKQANAATTATQQEIESANRAIALQQKIYQQQQQNLAPYMQLGASSLGNLQALAGRPIVSQNPSGFGYTARGSMPPAMSFGGGNSGMVMLRAPNGETKTVPANQAQQYVARGASVVG